MRIGARAATIRRPKSRAMACRRRDGRANRRTGKAVISVCRSRTRVRSSRSASRARLFHLVDSTRQFRSLKASDFSHAGIQGLFAATPNYPQWAWPRHGKSKTDDDGKPIPPPITSFKDDDVRMALMLACDALRQAPAEIVIHDKNLNRIRIGGVQQRCSLVVLKNFHGAPER